MPFLPKIAQRRPELRQFDQYLSEENIFVIVEMDVTVYRYVLAVGSSFLWNANRIIHVLFHIKLEISNEAVDIKHERGKICPSRFNGNYFH